jgi:hypothetical protein
MGGGEGGSKCGGWGVVIWLSLRPIHPATNIGHHLPQPIIGLYGPHSVVVTLHPLKIRQQQFFLTEKENSNGHAFFPAYTSTVSCPADTGL